MSIIKITKPQAPKTFRAALVKGVRGPIVLLLAALAVLAAGSLMGSLNAVMAAQPHATGDLAIPSYTENLIEDHGCWANAADMPADMEGVIPSHVIITLDGMKAAEYRGAKAVGVAFDQTAFDNWQHGDKSWGKGIDHDAIVHAYCR